MSRIVFLASGRGSNFEALARAIHDGTICAQAVALISDNPSTPALQIASKFGVPTRVLDKKSFRGPTGKWDRAAYERALEETIAGFQPDWICLAGYMLLLGGGIVRRWSGRILNIHPSLLPAFPGLHAQKQALEAGERTTGCTVHLVTEGLDEGPVLSQASVEILPGDTETSLSERLLKVEHATYVAVVRRLCADGFDLQGERVVWRQPKR